MHDKSLKNDTQLEEDASIKKSTTEEATITQYDASSGEHVALWENGKQSLLDNTNKTQVENSERNRNENLSGEQTVENQS
jgi:hypothetical protein